MHRTACLIAFLAALSACDDQKPPEPAPPPALPKGLLTSQGSTTAQKKVEESSGRDCTPPHTGLETVTVYLGLDQLAFPLFIPSSYDPKSPPPLVVFVPDRYFEVSKWQKDADLFAKAEEHGYVVVVVHRFKSPAGSSDVQSAITSTAKQLCFDPDRVYAIGTGSGAKAVTDAACEGGIAAIMTSGARPVPDCARSSLRHLHFANEKDKTLPLDGAKPRALSKHEDRIRQQLDAMSFANIPLKRDILPRQEGDTDTPCTPPDGIIDIDEFTTAWCGPLGCADAEPAEKDGCEVREGRGSLMVCNVKGGRIWTPNYPPFAGCYGAPDKKYDYFDRTFRFFGASKDGLR